MTRKTKRDFFLLACFSTLFFSNLSYAGKVNGDDLRDNKLQTLDVSSSSETAQASVGGSSSGSIPMDVSQKSFQYEGEPDYIEDQRFVVDCDEIGSRAKRCNKKVKE